MYNPSTGTAAKRPGASCLVRWVGPPIKNQVPSLQAFKLDSPQALGYYRIMNKKEITEKIFNEHIKNKLRPEWRSFSKWKNKFKHCYAYFSNNKLFHVGK